MLLSPPFLPATNPEQTFIDRAMVEGQVGDGGYPVSYRMNWHGGIHLTAPAGTRAPLPVRAIADGTVQYLRAPTAENADPTHPLNYRGGWTDVGCVVLRHETDIGLSAGGQRTSVVFYSIYMHLQRLARGLALNQQIYRMGEVGRAGRIYGQANRIHFEIICDDGNVQRLTGRNRTYTPVGADGRRDVVYGAIWFMLLVDTPFFNRDPRLRPRRGHPPPPTLVEVYRNTEALHVRMDYARGDCTLGTLHLDGRLVAERTDDQFEYTLHATARADYPQSPSAGLELLRFGRVIGPDPLAPPNAPHWRQVCYPGGTGWVNLNGPTVRKFSDADFPHWDHWWMLVDASSSNDSRCDEPDIRHQLDANHDWNLPPDEAQRSLNDPAIQQRLSRKICKCQTEWDSSQIDKQWGWLRTDPTTRMTEADFRRFKAHVTALSFWGAANLGIDAIHWHFNPKMFIRQFRQCLWLSETELAQCIPRRVLVLSGAVFRRTNIATWATATQRARDWANDLNTILRRYMMASTTQRLAHFLAQVLEESGYLRYVKEIGGEHRPYAPYYGRGLIQLTHLPGYRLYGEHRQFLTTHPNPAPPFANLGWNPDDLIARDNPAGAFNRPNCADSSGHYWTNAGATATGRNGLAVSDGGTTTDDVIACSRLTNGNVALQNINGLELRIENFIYLKYVLFDLLRPGPTEQVQFTWRRNSAQEPVLDANGQPVPDAHGRPRRRYYPTNHTIDVPLDAQRPP